MQIFKRATVLVLALVMIFSLIPVQTLATQLQEDPGNTPVDPEGTYTLDMTIPAMPVNWSPMSWSSEADKFVMQYTQTPLVDITVKNTEAGEYQWAFLAATGITDVTGSEASNSNGGSVFEISLNPDLCWEDGTPINADTYIWSMQQILDPGMQYAKASSYYEGALGIAGARKFYFSGRTVYELNDEINVINSEADLVLKDDGNYYTPNGDPLYVALNTPNNNWLGGSLKEYVDAYGDAYFDMDAYAQLEALADADYFVVLSPESLELLQAVISKPAWGEGPEYFTHYICAKVSSPVADWSEVGLHKVDDYTLRYVTAEPATLFRFLYSISGQSWLIHQELYENCKEAGTYGTAPETSMSYGPYKLHSMNGTKVTLVRNEKHFEYTADANGTLSSVSSFRVDGSYVPQWQMDVINGYILADADAKQPFLAGELDIWKVPSAEMDDYVNSPARYSKSTGNTYSIIFNTDPEVLQGMDANYGTTYAAVLSSDNFRKAFSLAYDRSSLNLGNRDMIPVLTLFDDTFYYDAENDPASVYRKSDAAMQVICDLYGVKYGPGTPYATLKDAYESIDGYDLEQARELMAQACKELVSAGLYTEGEPIVLTYAASRESDFHNKVARNLESILNAAAQGSGFGTISVEARISGWDCTSDMREGKACIFHGGWAGSSLDPFGLMEVYLNPDYSFVPLNMDTSTELLTLNISGQDHTMTWYEWCKAINGKLDGSQDAAKFYHNVEVLAKLEAAYLQKLHFVPVSSDAVNYLLSYQVEYITDECSILYGFGGTRLMRFNYTDDEWKAYVASGAPDYRGSGDSGCSGGHTYTQEVTKPTCTEKGYTSYTCSVCGDSYIADYTDALGHEYVDGVCSRCDAAQEAAFTDVPESAYYFEPVEWAVEKDITSGTGDGIFSPGDSCTRAQVVTFLWRAAGEPEPTSTDNPFTDISKGSYYYNAVLWAVEKGITAGVSDTKFDPYGNCTRAQVVTFLWRAADKPASASTDNPFTDMSKGSYYYNAVLWAVENDITSGTGSGSFSPLTICNRAQVVTFLYRAYS